MRFNGNNILSLLALFSIVQADSSENCLGIQTVEDRGYHRDCDLRQFNRYKGSLKKKLTQRKLTESGIHNVPDEKTVVCPVGESSLVEGNMIKGQDTVWFVENDSSSPVVLAWVQDGVEYSAMNRKITPPQADPEAILPPGEWKPVHAFESEIFHVRQLLGGVAGPLLLQHRAGLVPISGKTRKQGKRTPISPQAAARRNEVRPGMAGNYEWNTCYVIDIGFRNHAGEPLNGFWLDPVPGQCKEHNKFHLGTNPYPSNFAFDFDSNTKFEKSYIGHTFVFRSVMTGELVATHTLAPTKVTDCPGRKKTSNVLVSGEVQDIKVGNRNPNLEGYNATEELGEYLKYASDEDLEYLKSLNVSMIPLTTAGSASA